MISFLYAWLMLCQITDGTPLVFGGQIKHVGSFDIPESGTWQDPPNKRFDYSMGTICYREDRDALYVVTHAHDPTSVGLIQIPEQLSPSVIPVGTLIQAPMYLPSIPNKRVHLRGLYWDQPSETLYYNYTVWYNVAGEDAPGLGALRDGKPLGLWFAAHNNASAGYITRDTKSNRLLIGSAIAQGIASSSLGPSVYRLDWNERMLPEANSRIPLQTLLFHPNGTPQPDPTHYATMSSGRPWWPGMEVSGGVCVDGTLMVVLDEGERSFYGSAEEFRDRIGFSPRSNSKGYHNDPYQSMLWFYSLDELDQGPKTVRDTSHVRPYEYLRVAEIPEGAWTGGLAFDPQGRRLFVSQSRANAALTPRIHVYRIDR